MKLRTLSIVIFLLTAIFGFLLSYYVSYHMVEKQLGDDAITTLRVVKIGINPSSMKTVVATMSDTIPEYEEIHNYLNNVRESTGLKYLYTFFFNTDGSITYLVDGYPKNSENFSKLGDRDTDPAITPERFGTKDWANTKIRYYEQWGYLKTVYLKLGNFSGKSVYIGADFDADFVRKEAFVNSINISLLIMAFEIVFIILISYILRKIKVISTLMKEFAKGDLTKSLDFKGKDELSDLLKDIEHTRVSLVTLIGDVKNSMNTASSEVDSNRKLIEDTTENFHESIEELKRVFQNISSAINNVTASTEEIGASASSMSDSIHRFMNELESATKSLSMMSKNAIESRKMMEESVEALRNAKKSGEEISKLVNELSGKNTKIEDVLVGITGIAEQTNLLALNAAIEAARAGEAGRGFAVVADEIRKLAEQSKLFVEQAKSILQSIFEDIRNIDTGYSGTLKEIIDSTSRINSASESYNIISTEAERISKILGDLTVEGRSQGEMVGEIADAINGLVNSIEEVAKMVNTFEETIDFISVSFKKIQVSSDALTEAFRKVDEDISKFKTQ
ncbi:methyl-accepting chemotaxis protein [Fervidobacterium sp.]